MLQGLARIRVLLFQRNCMRLGGRKLIQQPLDLRAELSRLLSGFKPQGGKFCVRMLVGAALARQIRLASSSARQLRASSCPRCNASAARWI